LFSVSLSPVSLVKTLKLPWKITCIAVFIQLYYISPSDKQISFLKIFKLKSYDQNGGKMTKIDTLFMTKTAEKPYPFGAHIREYPPGEGGDTTNELHETIYTRVMGKEGALI